MSAVVLKIESKEIFENEDKINKSKNGNVFAAEKSKDWKTQLKERFAEYINELVHFFALEPSCELEVDIRPINLVNFLLLWTPLLMRRKFRVFQ